ncbi:MAG: SDR family NAD(P)-dependent oxidoreductase [Muribaculaceae bacterium]|nr:SDR family NAD(P)-dependent oxidoreductase [Muribaculaceae bacterium]
MADNYLERKMEDLRSGRLGSSTGKVSTSRPVYSSRPVAGNSKTLNFNLTSRRILIIGGCSGIGENVTQAFVKAGCRVAVFDTDREEGQNITKDGRIRFTPFVPEDTSTLERAWQNLITAWHDVDTVVITIQIPDIYTLAKWWASRRNTHPVASLHNSIILLLYPTRNYLNQENNSISQNNTSSQPTLTAGQEEADIIISEKNIDTVLYRLYNILHQHNIDVKALGYVDNNNKTVQNCLFLAVPGMGNNRIIMY